MVPSTPSLSLSMAWASPIDPTTKSLEELCAAWPGEEASTVRPFWTALTA